MKGQNIGYIRVSTAEQNTARQEGAMQHLELDKVFIDHASGKNSDRPQLLACLNHVREGDHLYVASIDRLARNLGDLLGLLKKLTSWGVAVHFLKENLVFTGEDNPFQKLQLQLIGAVAEFERSLIKERQKEGIAIAKRAGKYKGRKAALAKPQIEEIIKRSASGERKAKLALEFGVSRQTIYNALQG